MRAAKFRVLSTLKAEIVITLEIYSHNECPFPHKYTHHLAQVVLTPAILGSKPFHLKQFWLIFLFSQAMLDQTNHVSSSYYPSFSGNTGSISTKYIHDGWNNSDKTAPCPRMRAHSLEPKWLEAKCIEQQKWLVAKWLEPKWLEPKWIRGPCFFEILGTGDVL